MNDFDLRAILSGTFLFAGVFLFVVASIGLVRFPDFYSRLHPAGKTDTLGQMLALFGLIIYEGISVASFKLLVIIVFLSIANPTAAHALAKAAYAGGTKPFTKGEDIEPTRKQAADKEAGKEQPER